MINLFNSEKHEHDWEKVEDELVYGIAAAEEGVVIRETMTYYVECSDPECNRRERSSKMLPQRKMVIPFEELGEWEGDK